jgi:hypothetical protein
VISAGEMAQKIGITWSDPQRRLIALRTDHSARLSLLGFARTTGDVVRRAERDVRALLYANRIHGEWFSVSPVTAIETVKQVARVAWEMPAVAVDGQAMTEPAMSGLQMRAALLGLSGNGLAELSGVSLVAIRRAEGGRRLAGMIRANGEVIRRALENAGVEFIPPNGGGPGIRLRRPKA